jgi:hypothetical protein
LSAHGATGVEDGRREPEACWTATEKSGPGQFDGRTIRHDMRVSTAFSASFPLYPPCNPPSRAAGRAIVAHPIVLRCGVLDQAQPIMGPLLSHALDRGT